MKAMLSNNVLTVKLTDGTLLTTTEGSKELYFKVIQMDDDNTVRELLMGELTVEDKRIIAHNEEVKVIKAAVEAVVKKGDFYTEGNDMYLNGVSISLPKVLVKKFLELQNKMTPLLVGEPVNGFNSELEELIKEEEALKNFWRWAAQNKNPQSREDLYTFVEKNGIKVTPNGNMILYRRIVKNNEGNPELLEFVTTQWVRVKKNKKNPANFNVLTSSANGEFIYVLRGVDKEIHNSELLEGNLKELYNNLSDLDSNLYTDAHTKKLTIKVGSIYKIDESEVDTNNSKSCSGGLHCASRNYDYGSFGDTPVMVLVNPSKVRAVPIYDTGKMRVVEMFVAAILEIDEYGRYIDEDVNMLELDEDYFNISLDELKELAEKEGATEDKGQGTLGIRELTISSLNSIINSFDEVKKTLAKRTVKL